MKKTFLAALALGAAPSLAPAQEAMRPPRVGIIDLGVISRDSQLGKGYAARIEALEKEIQAEVGKKQGEVQRMEGQIKTLQDELEKQGSVLSAEAADRKRQEITRKNRERQAFVEDSQAELQRMRERAQAQAESLNGEFQQKIRPHIEAVAKEKGLDIILTSQVAITMNKEYDISPAVISRVDAAEKASPAPSRGASAAPARPAGSPTPAPSPTPKP